MDARRVTRIIAVVAALLGPAVGGAAWGQEYVGLNTCSSYCHPGIPAGVLSSRHPDQVTSPIRVLVTNGLGESGPDCTPGTSIFDPCTSGHVVYVAPFATFFDLDRVEYVLGGYRAQRFLTQTLPIDDDAANGAPDNVRLLSAREFAVMGVQWNVGRQRWEDYHGPTVEDDWHVPDRRWNRQCAACHTTGFDPATDFWVEQGRAGAQHGVTCEACHGPSSMHVNNPIDFQPSFPTAFPGGVDGPPQTLAEAKRRLEICGQCHGRGASVPEGTYGYPYAEDAAAGYVPGEILDDYYTQTDSAEWFWPDGTARSHHQQYNDFLLSGHWIDPDVPDKLECATCHDPHGNGTEVGELRFGGGNALCLSCHPDLTGGAFDRHTGRMSMFAAEVKCRDCHMPLTAMNANAYDLRSHTFRIIPPANTVEPSYEGMPNSCTSSCHTAGAPGPLLSPEIAQQYLYQMRAINGGARSELHELVVDRSAGELLLSWAPSTDANHVSYKLYRSTDASSARIDSAHWRDVSGEDSDGDPGDAFHSRPVDPTVTIEYFVVVDQGSYVGDSPWGHYFR